MSDKELIKQEIERMYKKAKLVDCYSCSVVETTLDRISDFINSIPEEPASEGLEEEIINYFNLWQNVICEEDCCNEGGFCCVLNEELKPITLYHCKKIARHFAEWQREKDIRLEKIDDFEEFAQKWAYSNYHKELDGVNCDCLYSGVKKRC